jgi:hypothetical protein
MVLRSLLGLAFASLAVLVAALQPACGFDAMGTAASTSTPTPTEMDGGSLSDGPSAADGSNPGLDMPATCPSDHVVCDGTCVDPKSDPSNCSACGKSCAFNEGCKDGACFLLCAPGTTECGGACVDVSSDLANCGKCNTPCATLLLCSAGVCKSTCTTGLTRCVNTTGATCVDLSADPKNCGACGTPCGATERCTTGKCTSFCAAGVVVGDAFATNMVGCVGSVPFANRATLCAPGVATCGVADYRSRRGGKPPHYNYWTNDVLYGAGDTSTCAVSPVMSGTFSACSSTTPMRVCAANTDAVGNQCNGTGCGYEAYSPNEYFGGCTGNANAGTLCCPP